MTFIPNPAFEEEVRNSADVEALLTENAEAVKGLAEAIAPYQGADEREPHVRDSFSVERADEPGEVDVVNSSPHFVFVEFGTADTAPQPSLGPALDAVVGRSS